MDAFEKSAEMKKRDLDIAARVAGRLRGQAPEKVAELVTEQMERTGKKAEEVFKDVYALDIKRIKLTARMIQDDGGPKEYPGAVGLIKSDADIWWEEEYKNG